MRFSSLGDILLTTPVLVALRHTYPNATIVYATKREFESLFSGHPSAPVMVYLEKGERLARYSARLRAFGPFDVILDLHASLRSRMLTPRLSGPVRQFKKPYFRRFLYVNFKQNLYREVEQIPDRYLAMIGDLVPARPEGGGRWPVVMARQKPELRMPPAGSYVAIAPGARWATKAWPRDHFRTLLQYLSETGIPVVLLGGPAEVAENAELASGLQSTSDFGVVTDLTGRLSLAESADVLSRAMAVVVNDSGAMHIASVGRAPIIALFLSTVPEFGFTPYRDSVSILQTNVECRPCDHKGLKKCPKGHFRCGWELEPDTVISELQRVLNGTRR